MVQHHHVRKIHSKKRKEPLDYFVYFFTIATPLFEIPQAYEIYSSQDAESVSLLTWSFFFMASVVLLAYAIKNRLKPLIVMYTLYMMAESTIVVGIVLYS